MAISLAASTVDRGRAVQFPKWPAVAPPRRRRMIALVALVSFCTLAASVGWIFADNGTTADPPQVAEVVAMMTPNSSPPRALLAGEDVVIANQPLHVRAYQIDGEEAIAATSLRPLPMPSPSHLLAGSSPTAWMATRDGLSLYGVNRPAGAQSMFLVAAMPMEKLPGIAARLSLI